MRYARFASFVVGAVVALVVGVVVTEVALRRIFFSPFVGISAVVTDVLATAVTTRS